MFRNQNAAERLENRPDQEENVESRIEEALGGMGAAEKGAVPPAAAAVVQKEEKERRGSGRLVKSLADEGIRHQKGEERRHGDLKIDSFHRASSLRRLKFSRPFRVRILPLFANGVILAEPTPVFKFRRGRGEAGRLTKIPSEDTIIELGREGRRAQGLPDARLGFGEEFRNFPRRFSAPSF